LVSTIFQGAETKNTEGKGQTTPSSTFKQPIGPILEDQVLVNSNPHKDGEDLEIIVPELVLNSHIEGVAIDRQPINGGNE
jgi:hypothetical protein